MPFSYFSLTVILIELLYFKSTITSDYQGLWWWINNDYDDDDELIVTMMMMMIISCYQSCSFTGWVSLARDQAERSSPNKKKFYDRWRLIEKLTDPLPSPSMFFNPRNISILARPWIMQKTLSTTKPISCFEFPNVRLSCGTTDAPGTYLRFANG